ncbi:MAG: hypothetical protein M3O50_02075 [Myxococcota bacterium]|nr:hypothetical protein [Myxococcota bacterium]
MLLYFVPPMPLFVLAVAYLFQLRATELRSEAGLDDSRSVRITRGVVHAAFVFGLAVYAPMGLAAMLAALRVPPDVMDSPFRALPGLLIVFFVSLIVLDAVADGALALLSGAPFDALVRTRLRLSDLTRLEVPDVVLLTTLYGVLHLLTR